MRVEERANAKINLSLDVLSKRPDGYHNVDLIMQEIDFFDEIIIEKNKRRGFNLIVDGCLIKDYEKDLIYQAWQELKSLYRGDPSVNIFVDKNIPLAAGLAGGSSDFASTVRLLNKLWDLGLTRDEMIDLSKKYGADIPFFFMGGSCRATGIGQDLESLGGFSGKRLILVNNGQGISSAEAYAHIKLSEEKGPMDRVVKYIEDEDVRLYDIMYNRMENYSLEKIPEIGQIKEELVDLGARVSLMSGSGPTVFAIFDDESRWNYAYKKLLGKYKYVIKTRTI